MVAVMRKYLFKSSLYSWSSSGTEEEAEEERLNEMEGVPEEIVGYASDLVGFLFFTA